MICQVQSKRKRERGVAISWNGSSNYEKTVPNYNVFSLQTAYL